MLSRYYKPQSKEDLSAYSETVCSALENYPLISPVPGKSVAKKVEELSQLVAQCSKERNDIAHEKDREMAAMAINDLFQKYGKDWETFIREIIEQQEPVSNLL